MKRVVILAIAPLFGGLMFAQTQTTTTTTQTWNGTLVNAQCYQQHTSQSKSTSVDQYGNTTTRTTTSVVSECPVTTTTTQFGVVTPSGQFVMLNPAGNQEVVTMVRKHHKWHEQIVGSQPINVEVVGTPGPSGTVVVREIK
ncbi:MAG TPA: hypothetical protein VKX45_14125 [Bryobacteraceae bacterium]|jgi:hypothetical protein|nr:hypothetical protein [Bryobacteraceae bacterium]